jgi:hypothetical protein
MTVFDTDTLRKRVKLEDYVGQSVSLRRYGTNMKGLCPFHTEDTPSFNVNVKRQQWHCFGCGKGGDIFSFVMEQRQCTFVEAAKHLGTVQVEGDGEHPVMTPEGQAWITAAQNVAVSWRRIMNLQDEKNLLRARGTQMDRENWRGCNRKQSEFLVELRTFVDALDAFYPGEPNGWQLLPLVRLTITVDLEPFVTGSPLYRQTCIDLITNQ